MTVIRAFRLRFQPNTSDPSIVAVSAVPLKEKLAALAKTEHQAYEISFLNKDGKEVPNKGDAKVILSQ